MRTASNYQVKENENHLVHVRFTKIMKDGARTKDVHYYQQFHPREYDKMKAHIDRMGLKGITQYNEMEVVHDPRRVEKVEPKKVEPKVDEPKVDEPEQERNELKQFLFENDIAFDSRLGVVKLRALKAEYESLNKD